MFYIYVWNKRITLKILPCMAALNTFRTDGEDFGEQILSKVVKAGRRTYFLDVRATRANDYFLTITESRKKTAPDERSVTTGIKYSFTKRIFPNSSKAWKR